MKKADFPVWKSASENAFPLQIFLPVFQNSRENFLRDQAFVTAAVFASGRPDATFLTGLCQ